MSIGFYLPCVDFSTCASFSSFSRLPESENWLGGKGEGEKGMNKCLVSPNSLETTKEKISR